MPNPRKGESESNYMERCVPVLVGEGKDQKQAVAICLSMYREKEKSKVKVTDNYIHIPVKSKKKGNAIRTISLGKGIIAHYDVKRKVIIGYLFDTTKYDMKKARKWIKEHSEVFDYAVELAHKLFEDWGEQHG